jgi:hypothetical protein
VEGQLNNSVSGSTPRCEFWESKIKLAYGFCVDIKVWLVVFYCPKSRRSFAVGLILKIPCTRRVNGRKKGNVEHTSVSVAYSNILRPSGGVCAEES